MYTINAQISEQIRIFKIGPRPMSTTQSGIFGALNTKATLRLLANFSWTLLRGSASLPQKNPIFMGRDALPRVRSPVQPATLFLKPL